LSANFLKFKVDKVVSAVQGLLSNKKKVGRKTFAARDDLLEELSKFAKQSGTPLFTLVNEVFEVALEAKRRGVSLRETLEGKTAFEKVKSLGFIEVPEVLWRDLLEDAYALSGEAVLKKHYEAGRWLAKRLASRSRPNAVEELKSILEATAWNAVDFTIKVGSDAVDVELVNPRFSKAHADAFSRFLEGCLEELGYEIVSKESLAGMIRVKARGKSHG
jgi:hypothetical protein